MQKNVAGQKVIVFAFDSTTNLPKSGDAANLTAYVSKDFGAVTVLGDTSATEMDATNAKGFYLFDLTQAETNADTLVFTAKSSTANVVVIGQPATVFTTPAAFAASLDTSGRITLNPTQPGVTFSGLTTGALSCTTVTASGAVAFQSTFAVTGTTTLAALTTTGTVTFAALSITGATTFTGAWTASNASNNVLLNGVAYGSANAILRAGANAATTFSGALTIASIAVGGATTFTGAVTANNASNSIKINGVTPGASGGLLISGSNTGTTTFGALTVTGAVAFQSTFDVTGTTSFAAVTVSGATTFTGAVTATNASNDIRGIQVGSFTAGAITTASFTAGAINSTVAPSLTFLNAYVSDVANSVWLPDNGGPVIDYCDVVSSTTNTVSFFPNSVAVSSTADAQVYLGAICFVTQQEESYVGQNPTVTSATRDSLTGLITVTVDPPWQNPPTSAGPDRIRFFPGFLRSKTTPGRNVSIGTDGSVNVGGWSGPETLVNMGLLYGWGYSNYDVDQSGYPLNRIDVIGSCPQSYALTQPEGDAEAAALVGKWVRFVSGYFPLPQGDINTIPPKRITACTYDLATFSYRLTVGPPFRTRPPNSVDPSTWAFFTNSQADVQSWDGNAVSGVPDSPAANATAVWAFIVEAGYTATQILRGLAAFVMGEATGGNTTNPKFKSMDGATDRIDMTVDANGNRTAVTRSL